MPRFYPSILISDAYGSVGEVTFYHRNGKCYYRKRSHSRYPGTAAQTSALNVHRRALAAWREVPHQTQQVWNRLAEEVEPHRPPFDHKAFISGQNLFVSAYHGFATLGNEHQPSPVPFESFPPFAAFLGDAVKMKREPGHSRPGGNPALPGCIPVPAAGEDPAHSLRPLPASGTPQELPCRRRLRCRRSLLSDSRICGGMGI